MSKLLFARTSLSKRLSPGVLSPQLNSFAIVLNERRYSPATIHLYVRECDIFRCWLEQISAEPEELTAKTVERYLTMAPRYTTLPTSGKRRTQARPAIHAFVRHLQETGYLNLRADENAPVSEVQQWLDRYREHLDKVLGLASSTQERYLLFAARFLERQTRTGLIDWSKVTPAFILGLAMDAKVLGKGRSPQRAVASIRPFLRFLVSAGIIPSELINILPGRKRRPQSIPQGLTEAELKHLLTMSRNDTPIGKRNYAILVLLARLGLRAGEVRSLQLEDFNWRNGCVLIRAGKTQRQRILPLQCDVSKAVLCYLQTGRPETSHRQVFVEHVAPFGPLQHSAALTRVVKGFLAKAGIERHRSGAHLLRHTLATRMVNHGASFFEVADVLGHQSVRSTLVYAKLDMERLSQVALPWTGGDQ